MPGIDPILPTAAQAVDLTAALPRPEGKGIGEAAQGFEALLLTQMLKGLRRTVPEDPDKSAMSGMYQELMDEHLAVELAKHGGIGLAKVIATYMQAGPGPKVPVEGAKR